MFDEQPNSKLELIKAIQEEYAKIAKIDQDAETVYHDVKEQLRLHAADPIVLSPTSGDVQKVQYLAKRYGESYNSIATLLEELDREQNRAGMEYRGWNKQ